MKEIDRKTDVAKSAVRDAMTIAQYYHIERMLDNPSAYFTSTGNHEKDLETAYRKLTYARCDEGSEIAAAYLQYRHKEVFSRITLIETHDDSLPIPVSKVAAPHVFSRKRCIKCLACW